MKTKPFSELRKRMTPEQREESETLAKLMLLHLTLMELQQSLGLGQDYLEKDLGSVDCLVPDIQNPGDIQVSTLSRCIKALGGSLKLVADFPSKEIVLAQFD